MLRSIAFNFSKVFDGVIWATKVSTENEIIVFEIRNSVRKEVRFSALELKTQEFLWQDKLMEEPWWINLAAVSSKIVLFTLYTDTQNPDKKAAIACNLLNADLVWWQNDFSISSVSNNFVIGFSEKYGRREVVLDLNTGKTLQTPAFNSEIAEGSVRPQQFFEGHSYFDTVKTFFSQKFNLLPITALEYLEYDSLIFVSCYLQENDLTNYLFILSADGNLLLKEKMDEDLKGIGLDTFFILS
ncbi:MAG TPA: DUF4905 domain-containing protein, partial [Chryseolinea sp.]